MAKLPKLVSMGGADCNRCSDTGMEPGGQNRNIVVMPQPCRFCKRGEWIRQRLADEVALSTGGLPAAPVKPALTISVTDW